MNQSELIYELKNKFKLLLHDYLETGDGRALLLLINEHPEMISSEYGEYPDFHRIMDIQLGSKNYRVCRQISKNGSLILIEIDKLMDQHGVPLWLEGEKLKEWSQSYEDTNEPVDWEKYR